MSKVLVVLVALFGLTRSACLEAQVDMRLQKCLTDITDIYGGARKSDKPEMMMLIDHSSSMRILTWDNRYYSNNGYQDHAAILQSNDKPPFGTWGNNDDVLRLPFIICSLTKYPSPVSYFNATSPSNQTNKISYIIQMGALTGSVAINGGLFVKPNGDPVTDADCANASPTMNDYVERASHVRLAISSGTSTYTYKHQDGKEYTYNIPTGNIGFKAKPVAADGSYPTSFANIVGKEAGDTSRVVDIPLPWAAFDRVPNAENRSLTPAMPASLQWAKTRQHPQHLCLYDPVPDANGAATANAQWYEVDTHWWETAGTSVTVDDVSGVTLDGLNKGNGLINADSRLSEVQIDPDYLIWCLVGQDERNVEAKGLPSDVMTKKYTGTNRGGYVVPDVRDGGAGFIANSNEPTGGNGLPCLTRIQALKYALIKTYIDNQRDTYLAYRKLYDSTGLTGDNFSPVGSALFRLKAPTTTSPTGAMRYLQSMETPNNMQTPVTHSLANTYAQMAQTGNHVFNGQRTVSSVEPCRASYVVLLSDGKPTDNPAGGDPFSGGALTWTDTTQSQSWSAFLSGGSYFNLWSLAGVAAHDIPLTGGANLFRVTDRVAGQTRKINTITIGMGLPGKYTDPNSPKYGLYRAALYGLERRSRFNSTSLPLPFEAPQAGKVNVNSDPLINPLFFDAQSAEGIAQALKSAVIYGTREAIGTLGAPVAPLMGLGMGKEMYFATFNAIKDSPTWKGDLLAAEMSMSGSTLKMIKKDGTPLIGRLDPKDALWSAADMLSKKGWQNRTLYTAKPDPQNAGKFLDELLVWSPSTTPTDLPYEVLGLDATKDSATRRSLLRFMMGASLVAQNDTTEPTKETTSRGDIMGDIINSTPLILFFPLTKVPSTNTAMKAIADNQDLDSRQFKVIMVGDNQGILHAFGEVSGLRKDPLPAGVGRVCAAVDELWGFIPPDILKGLQTWRTGSRHLYLMDGSPVLYHAEKGTPNGLIDGYQSNNGMVYDDARVIVGLRKGGRSYYALKFKDNDPAQPALAWMIRPDDVSTIDANDSNKMIKAVIKNMGFSTSTPTIGRVLDENGIPRDMCFLGGGLSTKEVDEAFGDKLGRSLLAVPVKQENTQDVIKYTKAWDFILSNPDMGCVPAGVTPVEMILGSNKVQRVYFSTFNGGVHCVGAKASKGLRTDTSLIRSWEMRKIFQSKYDNLAVSTAPAVFPLPFGYPCNRTSDPKDRVSACGIVIGMGDRNDPMDRDSINPVEVIGDESSLRHRLICVLDRADSADMKTNLAPGKSPDEVGYTEADLADLTKVGSQNELIAEGNNKYYLKTKIGYRLDFARGTAKPGDLSKYYFEKCVISPLVLNKVLYFSVFNPQDDSNADACVGGGGTTTTYRMKDVLKPYNFSQQTQAGEGESGWVQKWKDIPSELTAVSMTQVVQVGTPVSESGTTSGNVSTAGIEIKGNQAAPASTIVRPRSWRIIR